MTNRIGSVTLNIDKEVLKLYKNKVIQEKILKKLSMFLVHGITRSAKINKNTFFYFCNNGAFFTYRENDKIKIKKIGGPFGVYCIIKNIVKKDPINPNCTYGISKDIISLCDSLLVLYKKTLKNINNTEIKCYKNIDDIYHDIDTVKKGVISVVGDDIYHIRHYKVTDKIVLTKIFLNSVDNY